MSDLAPIADECIHGMTAAWCSICKRVPKSQRASRARHPSVTFADVAAKALEPGPPYALAKFDSACPWCGYTIEEGMDHVYLRDECWVCLQCAQGYETHHGGNG